MQEIFNDYINNMFNYKLVIFDLDGTLINSEEGVSESIKIATKVVGVDEPTQEQLYSCIGPPLNVSFPLLGIKEHQMADAIAAMKKNYQKNGYKKAYIYEGLKEVLDELQKRNIKMAVATLKPTNMANIVLEHFELKKYFNYIIGPSGDDATNSTKSTYIARCLENLNIDGKDALMIGDYPSDAVGALDNNVDFGAAMFGFGFTKETVENYKYKYLLYSYDDLKTEIKSNI